MHSKLKAIVTLFLIITTTIFTSYFISYFIIKFIRWLDMIIQINNFNFSDLFLSVLTIIIIIKVIYVYRILVGYYEYYENK